MPKKIASDKLSTQLAELDQQLESLQRANQGLQATSEQLVVERDRLQAAVVELTARLNAPKRRKLPRERPSLTIDFTACGLHGYLHVGFYPDNGEIGELFIEIAKDGSTLGGMLKSFGRAVSVALQHGAEIEELVKKFSGTGFEPSGFCEHESVHFAKSVIDFIFKLLAWRFDLPSDGSKRTGPAPMYVLSALLGPPPEFPVTCLIDHEAKVAAARVSR